MKKPLVIFGASDAARFAHFYFTTDSDYEVVGFTVDASYLKDTIFCGRPVVPFEHLRDHYAIDQCEFFVAIGYSGINAARKEKYLAAKGMGLRLASYISSRTTVLNHGRIGENCFIFENNTIQPFASIGNNVMIWGGGIIGHHSTIMDHCYISPHVAVSAFVEVGEQCFIGTNATLQDTVKIGARCVIGAGTLIVADTAANGVYIGAASKARHERTGEDASGTMKRIGL